MDKLTIQKSMPWALARGLRLAVPAIVGLRQYIKSLYDLAGYDMAVNKRGIIQKSRQMGKNIDMAIAIQKSKAKATSLSDERLVSICGTIN